jgi:hypothetical protein
VQENLAQTKPNEDRIDAIISAYTAAYWWRFGTERSTMIGDLTTGYIVTPHSHRTYTVLAKVFGGRMNQKGRSCGVHHVVTRAERVNTVSPQGGSFSQNISGDRGLPVEPSEGWSEAVELTATDTSNIWRTSRGAVSNSWMDVQRMTGWRLWVRFIDEDGQPAVLFLPFGNQGSQQCGMKASPLNRGLWGFMVAAAARANPIRFPVCYRYEEIR